MSKEKISVNEFNEILKKSMSDGSALRVGQSLYSDLHEKYPDIIKRITNTDADPFYNDENIYELMKTICEDFE